MGKTVQIDDDVIQAAERLAAKRNTTVDKVVSDLAREGLALASGLRLIEKGGFWVLPSRGGVVTSEMVEQLAEDEP